MNRPFIAWPMAILVSLGLTGVAAAQDDFTLSSPVLAQDGLLPADLKCTRDGGDGLSPPIDWSAVPDGTESLALVMHHYPRSTVEGAHAPSQYWILWNMPASTTAIPRGNPASIGNAGADKDGRRTGYTPPCSPPGALHEYTITVYALNAPLDDLPTRDDILIDWSVMTLAMDRKIIASASLSFFN